VDASLLKAADGAVLYTRSFQALGAVRKFSAWAADDGQGLRDGLRTASEDVASQIANAVFPAPPQSFPCEIGSDRCAVGSMWNEVQEECMSGCARYYWAKPAGTAEQFDRDSRECAREAAPAPTPGEYGVFRGQVYRACLSSREWVREKRWEPPPPGWFRGFE
jgi:hypothetical protein